MRRRWQRGGASAPPATTSARLIWARFSRSTTTKHDAPVAWQDESLESLHFVPDGPRHDLPQLGARIMQSELRRLSEAEREAARTTFFACIAGTGLDAAVNRLTLEQPRWLRGHGGYVVALLQVLGGFQPPHITLSVEVDGRWQTRLDEPGFLIAAGNGPQYGHGMRLTHRAQMDDGLLDLCFVRPLSKLRLLRLFRAGLSRRPHRLEGSGIFPGLAGAPSDGAGDGTFCRRRVHLSDAGRVGCAAQCAAHHC